MKTHEILLRLSDQLRDGNLTALEASLQLRAQVPRVRHYEERLETIHSLIERLEPTVLCLRGQWSRLCSEAAPIPSIPVVNGIADLHLAP